jgi:hypothetical protein
VQVFQPIRNFAPAFEHIGSMPYPALQSMFDPLLPSGLQWYWKGDFVNQLSDEAITLHLMSDRHKDCKQQRHTQRQLLSETLTGDALTTALEQLEQASRRDGIERRQLQRRRDELLQPCKQIIDNADMRIQVCKVYEAVLSVLVS